MLLSPVLDPLDVLLAAEVIAVVVLADPFALSGSLAGSATLRCRTEALPIGVAIVGEEECFAAATLTSDPLTPHASEILEENDPDSIKSGPSEEDQTRTRKKGFQAKFRRRFRAKNTEFRTAGSSPLSIRRPQ